MKPTYTTSTGLQIGRMYESTVKPHHDADALRIQRALTGKHEPIDWDGFVIVVVVGVIAMAGWLLGGMI